MNRHVVYFAVFFFLAVLFSPLKILAAPYYQGKVITIIVGYGPGGGNDRLARLVAMHLPKYIPGKPSIIVQNMPGASSVIAANHLYGVAKPDGLTIGTFDRGLLFAQLLKAEGVKYDLRKFAWLGSATVETTIFTIRTDLPYKTFSDLKKAEKPIYASDTGSGGLSYQFDSLLKELTGLNLKMVSYPSNAESVLALERKEADSIAGSYSSLKPLIDKGLVMPIVRGRVSSPEIENVPVDEDLATDNIGKALFAIRSAPDQIGRPYVAPPGTPANVMSILRDAFGKMLNDPAIKEEANKRIMTVLKYVPANECQKVLNSTLNQPEEMVKKFGKYVKF